MRWVSPPALRSGVVTLLDEVLERDLDLGVIVRASDDRGLPQHVLADDLAVTLHRAHPHADPRQLASHLEIRLVLVAQAALQAAAHAGKLRRVERETLLLRHLHGNRLELAQPRRAAELAPAWADAADELRLVARADLLHL